MVRIVIGLLLGLLIGAGCRCFDIPLPGPPKIMGAMVILSVTLGYVGMDALLAARSKAAGNSARPATTAQGCGGPAVPPGGKDNLRHDKQVEETLS